MRREYSIIRLGVNGRVFKRVLIDPHVDKHLDHINDEVIIQLVYKLRGKNFTPVSCRNDFEYFSTRVKLLQHYYRLIWLTSKEYDFIGVITAYRDRRFK